MSTSAEGHPTDFIRDIVADDVRSRKNGGSVMTRFPPEPNGYLHIGHAQAAGLNYGIASENRGVFNLRFDDTNPTKESTDYVESIQRDLRWLGVEWGDNLYFASDYFEALYGYALRLIEAGTGLRLRPEPPGDQRVPRHPDGARHGEPIPQPLRRGESRALRRGCVPASSTRALGCFERRSTWRRATSTCATRSSTAS